VRKKEGESNQGARGRFLPLLADGGEGGKGRGKGKVVLLTSPFLILPSPRVIKRRGELPVYRVASPEYCGRRVDYLTFILYWRWCRERGEP